jgi:hypothetical protein
MSRVVAHRRLPEDLYLDGTDGRQFPASGDCKPR